MGATNTAIKYRPITGIAGRKSRDVQSENVEGKVVSGTNTPVAYGLGVVLDSSDQITAPVGATAITGIIFQSWPIQQQVGGMNASFGASVPLAQTNDNYMTAGYVTVKVPSTQATPAANGVVYVRVANGTTAQPIGGFETESSSDVIAVPNARWGSNGSGQNAQGAYTAEVAFNI